MEVKSRETMIAVSDRIRVLTVTNLVFLRYEYNAFTPFFSGISSKTVTGFFNNLLVTFPAHLLHLIWSLI
jgi:hypothetical protein